MARPADPHARAALITAARREFFRHGIQRARIEDITSACGLSKGSFYLHFESKEALFSEQVRRLQGELRRLVEERLAAEDAFFSAQGVTRPPRRAVPLDASGLAALDVLERAHDRATMELMWLHRDLVHVLISGSQGTPFEGAIWSIIDAEIRRVSSAFERLRRWGVCRSDLSPEVVSSVIVGAWVLKARQMSQLREKPNFDEWIDSISRLLAEGTTPPAARHPSLVSAAMSRRTLQRRSTRSHA